MTIFKKLSSIHSRLQLARVYQLYKTHHLLKKHGLTDQEVYTHICAQFIEIPEKIHTACQLKPTDTSAEKKIKYLIKSCLTFTPSQRPSVDTLLQEFSTLTVEDIKK